MSTRQRGQRVQTGQTVQPGQTRPTTVQAELVPGGPLLLRGAEVVLDADGEAHETTRPVVAVCTCDLSQRKPWCDGTHKLGRG